MEVQIFTHSFIFLLLNNRHTRRKWKGAKAQYDLKKNGFSIGAVFTTLTPLVSLPVGEPH
jgi:hypothetical protein